MTPDRPWNGEGDTNPVPLPSPFVPASPTGAGGYPAASDYPGVHSGYSGYPGGFNGLNGDPNGAPPQQWASPTPVWQSSPPRPRRGPLFHAAWIAGTVLVIGLAVHGTLFVSTMVADVVVESGSILGSETVLSDAWTVDGVDVVYVEAGGTECAEEACWEWLLMTQPDCSTATVTVEISESMYGDTQREVERSVAIDQVTSVLVEAEPGDGEFADLTSVNC